MVAKQQKMRINEKMKMGSICKEENKTAERNLREKLSQ